jgi:hypothetical protein
METEEEVDDDDNDEYSDDDDMSWKVRRSAAKCLEAVIATRHELLCEFYRTLSPALIARFKGMGCCDVDIGKVFQTHSFISQAKPRDINVSNVCLVSGRPS